jgi:hypothetical protein
MIYVAGVLVPIALQSLVVFITIQMNTGNGSWVGLGALLIGFVAIPVTALVNAIYIRANRETNSISAIARCYGIAAILPIIVVLLLMIG